MVQIMVMVWQKWVDSGGKNISGIFTTSPIPPTRHKKNVLFNLLIFAPRSLPGSAVGCPSDLRTVLKAAQNGGGEHLSRPSWTAVHQAYLGTTSSASGNLCPPNNISRSLKSSFWPCPPPTTLTEAKCLAKIFGVGN